MGDAVVNLERLPDGGVVVQLRGELDLAINDALRELLVDTATRLRPRQIIVDMLHVTFVDSTGIGALVAGHRAAVGAGVDFVVRDVAPFVARTLEQSGLHDRLVGPPPADPG
jgi:anti-sigma B factor antagonist